MDHGEIGKLEMIMVLFVYMGIVFSINIIPYYFFNSFYEKFSFFFLFLTGTISAVFFIVFVAVEIYKTCRS